MTNQLLLRIATVLMLFSINTAQAQTINANMTNTTANSRYTVHAPHADGTQTVTDRVTGLMWQQCNAGQTGTNCSGTGSKLNWQGALRLAATANLNSVAGYSNWRLPNIKELQSIVAYDRSDPSINAVVFPNTQITSKYWSSSPHPFISSTWAVHFNFGESSESGRGSDFHIRLVRSPQ